MGHDGPVIEVPLLLVGREREWRALSDFVAGGTGTAIVYAPHRAGASFLLDRFSAAVGGRCFRAAPGTRHTHLQAIGEFLADAGDPRPPTSWVHAFERLRRLDVPLLVLDDVPHLLAASPELPEVFRRYVDAGRGPVMVLAGSSQPAMLGLLAHGTPLFGKVSMALGPSSVTPTDLARLWSVPTALAGSWVDATFGALPGYRPIASAPGESLDAWMTDSVLAPGSAALHAAESVVGHRRDALDSGAVRAVLDTVARAPSVVDEIAAAVGVGIDDASTLVHGLERDGTLVRVRDLLRERRDTYDLADPHLRFWSLVVAPHRERLQAGDATAVWETTRQTWREHVLRRRWETVVREHAVRSGLGRDADAPLAVAGASAELELVVADTHRQIVVLGRTSVDRLGLEDLRMLERWRDRLGVDATLVLASVEGVDEDAVAAGALAVVPEDVYGRPVDDVSSRPRPQPARRNRKRVR